MSPNFADKQRSVGVNSGHERFDTETAATKYAVFQIKATKTEVDLAKVIWTRRQRYRKNNKKSLANQIRHLPCETCQFDKGE